MKTTEQSAIQKKYTVTTIRKPGSIVELSGSMQPDVVATKKEAALKRIGADLELPGFRKGKIPTEILQTKINELSILEEAASMALSEIIPDIIAQESLQLISMPSVRITKLVPEQAIEYTISVPVMPEIKLPEYKKIAKKTAPKKKEIIEVTDTEITEAMTNVQKTVTEWKRRKQTPSQHEPEHSHDEHDHSNNHEHTSSEQKESPTPLQPLTDEDVKMIGDYKDVTDFTEKLKQSLITEKEKKQKDKRRAEIAEKLVTETTIDIPDVMVDEELSVMLRKFKYDIEHMGMSFEHYLKELKKTEEELKKEWTKDAKKRVTLELVLAQIAASEKVSVNEEELNQEVKRYQEITKNEMDEGRVKEHIKRLMMNEEVFKLLEQE